MTDLESGNLGAEGATRRTDKAKELVGQAGHVLKAEAQSFASVAQDRVRAEAQKGAQVGARTLGDFANAVRRAGDELAEVDQSPASRLVRQAADGLESLSRNLADKDPGDILNSVRDFGRRNPAAFIGGAVLVGLALGRFARAAEDPTTTSGLADTDLGFSDGQPDAFSQAAGLTAADPGMTTAYVDPALSEDSGGFEADRTGATPAEDR